MPSTNPFRPAAHAPDTAGPRAEEWMADGLCRQVDPDLFFEASTERYEVKTSDERQSIAKAVCAKCPVRRECLEYALTHDERYGIWGGATERERRELKRRRSA
jgi:WhiB family transcriptional regulator, redox-sensing transcriptional regulator